MLFLCFFIEIVLDIIKKMGYKEINKWRHGCCHGGPLTGRAPAQEHKAGNLRGFDIW
jgi:hypothetical protein